MKVGVGVALLPHLLLPATAVEGGGAVTNNKDKDDDGDKEIRSIASFYSSSYRMSFHPETKAPNNTSVAAAAVIVVAVAAVVVSAASRYRRGDGNNDNGISHNNPRLSFYC